MGMEFFYWDKLDLVGGTFVGMVFYMVYFILSGLNSICGFENLFFVSDGFFIIFL